MLLRVFSHKESTGPIYLSYSKEKLRYAPETYNS